jgi:sodium transport system permease protein
VALTEVFAILLPALLWSRTRRRRVLQLLGLVPLSVRQLLGGALLGVALFFVLAVWIEPVLERLVPVPATERQQLLRLLHPPGGLRPLWLDLLCFAAAPAVCEEVLFRGAILAALLGRAGLVAQAVRARPVPAVLLCALLFGAFHLSWTKLLPTAFLGIGFGAAVVWSRSLWPAIVMHLVNNGLVIFLVRNGHDDRPLPAFSALGALGTLAALALLGGGAWLARPPASSLGEGA